MVVYWDSLDMSTAFMSLNVSCLWGAVLCGCFLRFCSLFDFVSIILCFGSFLYCLYILSILKRNLGMEHIRGVIDVVLPF